MQVRRESGSGRRTALRGRNGPLAGQLRETTPGWPDPRVFSRGQAIRVGDLRTASRHTCLNTTDDINVEEAHEPRARRCVLRFLVLAVLQALL